MPTIVTHAAVPLCLGLGLGSRIIPPRLLLAGVAIAMLPDVDVLAFKLGVAACSIPSPPAARGLAGSGRGVTSVSSPPGRWSGSPPSSWRPISPPEVRRWSSPSSTGSGCRGGI